MDVAEDALPVDDRGHGLLIELVSLDHEGGADRLDPELSVQGGAFRQGRLRGEHAHELCDLHAERIYCVVAFEWRFVWHTPSFHYRHYYTDNGGNQAFVRSCIHAACAVVGSNLTAIVSLG